MNDEEFESLESRFIKYISIKLSISEDKASEIVGKCVLNVSEHLDIKYTDVYVYLIQEYGSRSLPEKKALSTKKTPALPNKETPEKGVLPTKKTPALSTKKTPALPTKKTPEKGALPTTMVCHLPKNIMFEGKEYPRLFADANMMNEDPDRYVEKMSEKELTHLVKLAAYIHYNFDGNITDNTFDAFEYHLNKKLKLKGRRYEKIGAEPVTKIRAKLPYFMPSKEKVKPGSKKLYDILKTEVILSEKLDGVSLMVIYENGLPKKLYTRGDGEIGGDVSYLINYLRLPQVYSKLFMNSAIRGELVMSKNSWEVMKNSCVMYSNERSFVSATVNSGSLFPDRMKLIDFLAYELVDSENTSYKKMNQGLIFDCLENEGFKIPKFEILVNPTIFTVSNLYKTMRENSMYPIDGLIVGENTSGTITLAFKMQLESQIRSSKIINLEWNATRYGRLVPVAIFESVYIDGVRLHRASAFNGGHIQKWNMGKGTQVKIARSGDVIPAIVDVVADKNTEPIYPNPEKTGVWHWQKQDIILDDIDNNREVQLRKILHFFETIKVKGFGEKTVEKVWEAGIKSVIEVCRAPKSAFTSIKGVPKILHENIHNTLQNTRFDRFMEASTTLGKGISRKVIKKILSIYPEVMTESESKILKYLTTDKIPGIGPVLAKKISSGIAIFKNFLYSLNDDDIKTAIKREEQRLMNLKIEGANEKIKEKKFVFTGFFGNIDMDVEDFIYDNMGEIVDTVTPSTEAVIAASVYEITSKMSSAAQKGIPVYTIEEFWKKYKVENTGDITKDFKKFMKTEYQNLFNILNLKGGILVGRVMGIFGNTMFMKNVGDVQELKKFVLESCSKNNNIAKKGMINYLDNILTEPDVSRLIGEFFEKGTQLKKELNNEFPGYKFFVTDEGELIDRNMHKYAKTSSNTLEKKDLDIIKFSAMPGVWHNYSIILKEIVVVD